MKKFLALVLALCMVFALCACGAKTTTAAVDEGIPDEMTSADGKYPVAFVTDIGELKDGNFNEGTWEGVKQFASDKGLAYKYYRPANDTEATDDDRYDAMKAAVDNGAKTIVCAGYLQATALEKAAKEFTDVNFVFIDGWDLGLANVASISYQEEQCGFLAGYAAVMEGYTKLGFIGGGGGTNAACCRYGYGYIQGANAAAAEKGINVEMNYSWLYGAAFTPSADLEALMDGWYEAGTEVVFSCGGKIVNSVIAAASANDGVIIGVDVDERWKSETIITCALKGLAQGSYQALDASFGDNWSDWGGKCTNLGAAQDATGLPTSNWMLKNWSVDQYNEMFQKIVSGDLVIDNTVYENGDACNLDYSNITVTYVG